MKTASPLSLLAMRAAAFAYTLPRKSVLSIDKLEKYLSTQKFNVPRDCSRSYNDQRNSTEVDIGTNLEELPNKNITCDIQREFQNIDIDSSAGCKGKCNSSNCVDDITGDTNLQNFESDQVKCVRVKNHDATSSETSVQEVYARKLNLITETNIKNKSPLPQVEVEWGDAASELSAGKNSNSIIHHTL